jgi:hypothetical protein
VKVQDWNFDMKQMNPALVVNAPNQLLKYTGNFSKRPVMFPHFITVLEA